MVKTLIVLLALVAGCVSYWDGGPAYTKRTAPAAGAYVVVYRPKKQWGMNQPITAKYKTRDCEVVPGAYCVFFFPPGKHQLLVSIPYLIEAGIGGATFENGATTTLTWVNVLDTPTSTKLDLNLSGGQTLFVRAEVEKAGKPPIAEMESSADLDGFHLAAGGNARNPVAELPMPSAPTEGTSTPPVTTAPATDAAP